VKGRAETRPPGFAFADGWLGSVALGPDGMSGDQALDLQLLKTFLEVAATGSFGAASNRLFVTQSAVSLRVQRLEDELGRRLFDRQKNGVVLTSAGREFRGFATLILRNWDQARQRVSALEEAPQSLSVAAQSSLWPRFGFRWLDRLREELPKAAIRADIARPEALAELILSGGVQAILTCAPVHRPGLVAEPLMEDQLVLVSPWARATVDSIAERYALVDWGAEFRRAHDAALPRLADPRLVLGMGALAGWYLHNRALAAYLPARHAARHLAEGTLFLVGDAPIFPLPAWVTWREDMDPALRAVAGRTLLEAVWQAEAATAEALQHPSAA
jgi:DNA-binding transcriptional LysR family regulator